MQDLAAFVLPIAKEEVLSCKRKKGGGSPLGEGPLKVEREKVRITSDIPKQKERKKEKEKKKLRGKGQSVTKEGTSKERGKTKRRRETERA